MKPIPTLTTTVKPTPWQAAVSPAKLVTVKALGLVLLALCMAGCQSDSDSQAAKGSPSELADRPQLIRDWTPDWTAQKQRAEQWRDQMFQRLVAKLTETMVAQGPVKAIVVCKDDAPAIASELSRDGVRIGRTSFKLRNPKNVPPSWAAAFVNERVTEPQFVELESQTLGALLPIRLKDTCLMCHGSREQIPGDVGMAIRANYPKDQAVDFAENDLRGYFWVEVER